MEAESHWEVGSHPGEMRVFWPRAVAVTWRQVGRFDDGMTGGSDKMAPSCQFAGVGTCWFHFLILGPLEEFQVWGWIMGTILSFVEYESSFLYVMYI